MSKSESETASIEELYLKEKKKSNILLASTVLLAVLLVGSVVMSSGSNSDDEVASGRSLQETGQFQRGAGGPGGRGGQSIATFFDETGAVDQEAVAVLGERITQGGGGPGGDPAQFIERFSLQIDAAVENGDITETQATALKAEFAQLETSEI